MTVGTETMTEADATRIMTVGTETTTEADAIRIMTEADVTRIMTVETETMTVDSMAIPVRREDRGAEMTAIPFRRQW